MNKLKPADIPDSGITPESLSQLAGVKLAYIQGRTLQGRTPVVKGKISKRDAIALLRDAARAALLAKAKTDAVAPPASPGQAGTAPGGATPPNPPAGPSAALVQQQRLGRIADLLAQMVPTRTIRDRLSDEWRLNKSTVEKLIAQAYQDLAALGKIGAESRKDQMRDAFAEFYRDAMAIGDFKTAAVALDRLAKIDGCYAPVASKVEVDAGDGLVKLNAPDAVRARMAKLMEDPELLDKIETLTRGR